MSIVAVCAAAVNEAVSNRDQAVWNRDQPSGTAIEVCD
jgi:hypothetical protein